MELTVVAPCCSNWKLAKEIKWADDQNFLANGPLADSRNQKIRINKFVLPNIFISEIWLWEALKYVE